MLRPETKARARALQVLYAMEVGGDAAGEAADAVARLERLAGPDPVVFERATALVEAVWAERAALDRHAAAAADNWRLDRIAAVERNILRIGVHELLHGTVPPRVAIDEAVRLAHRFCGGKAAAFVNGVLDRVAHALGCL